MKSRPKRYVIHDRAGNVFYDGYSIGAFWDALRGGRGGGAHWKAGDFVAVSGISQDELDAGIVGIGEANAHNAEVHRQAVRPILGGMGAAPNRNETY